MITFTQGFWSRNVSNLGEKKNYFQPTYMNIQEVFNRYVLDAFYLRGERVKSSEEYPLSFWGGY